jgi:hypothetical protein
MNDAPLPLVDQHLFPLKGVVLHVDGLKNEVGWKGPQVEPMQYCVPCCA